MAVGVGQHLDGRGGADVRQHVLQHGVVAFGVGGRQTAENRGGEAEIEIGAAVAAAEAVRHLHRLDAELAAVRLELVRRQLDPDEVVLDGAELAHELAKLPVGQVAFDEVEHEPVAVAEIDFDDAAHRASLLLAVEDEGADGLDVVAAGPCHQPPILVGPVARQEGEQHLGA